MRPTGKTRRCWQARPRWPRRLSVAGWRVRRGGGPQIPRGGVADRFQLACYLSAAWLNLPVMRLVQRVMLPESDTSHLAEVFLSGLLRAVHADDGTDPEIVQYDFLPEVRDELNTYLLRDEMLDVLRETSQFVTERFGQPLDFAALLADPEGTPLPALAGEGGPRLWPMSPPPCSPSSAGVTVRSRAVLPPPDLPPKPARLPQHPICPRRHSGYS